MHIGIVAYDGCFAAEIFGLSDLLIIANRADRLVNGSTKDRFRVSVMASSDRLIRTAGGIEISARKWHRRVDALVVPGFELVPARDLDVRLASWRAETEFVASVAKRQTPIASVCVGAFLLGEAGVLDGRACTTSWLFAPELSRRYPRASVDASSLIVEDTGVTTTAAFSSTLDLGVHLIRQELGAEFARAVARVTLVSDSRESQAPYIDLSLLPVAGASFSDEVKAWLGDRLVEPYDLATLSAAFNVSTRTMLRKFRSEAGDSPLGYLQQARVAAAKRLLEASDQPVSYVMEAVGYLDPGTFRRLFITHVGLTPTMYRRQFRPTQRTQQQQAS